MNRVPAVILLLITLHRTSLAPAGQVDERLDSLFADLQTTKSVERAATLIQLIWGIWVLSEKPSVNELMTRGIEAMSRRNFEGALRAFDEIVKINPDFAEGWNNRATVHYLMGKYESSLRDIERTLALEPRHFGALSRMGSI